MDNINPYDPCPCGSGKKYKFCCLQKRRDREAQEKRPSFWAVSPFEEAGGTGYASLTAEDLASERVFCEEGLRRMKAGEFEKAITLFQAAILKAPFVYTAANNLALCLFVTGKLGEAVRVQSESRSASPFPNPFGLVNQATFLYVNGDEDGARRLLDEALEVPLPSADACVKVCETLARFKRHQAILDVADASEYGRDPAVCFFTGVAAANLGDRSRAQLELRRVNSGHFKADWVRRYLQNLKEGSSPHTIRGDWPYLSAYEVCPLSVVEAEFKRDQTAWLARRVVVDFFEAFLNEEFDKADSAMQALRFATHPDATALLWMIAKGSFGPDSLRMDALGCLQERGEIEPQQRLEVLCDGKRREVVLSGTKLSPDFRFGDPLPPEVDTIYAAAVEAGTKKNPDWAALGKIYQRVMAQVPGFYPARFNYVVSLLYRRRMKEAERILIELVEKHPEYLFARAALLQLLLDGGRKKEADTLVEAYVAPAETHPGAMIAWLTVLVPYHEQRKDFELAFKYAQQAYQIAPDNPKVKNFWEAYKDWEG